MHEIQPAGDDNTPLGEDDADGLIPSHLTTRAELNQWEAVNIAQAVSRHSTGRRRNILSTQFLRELHRQMFDRTWSWAGSFRRSDNNISPYHWSTVATRLHDLVENTRAQFEACEKTDAELDEIAVRFHHELVRIHPWPNGNGRHARLATDLLLRQWRRPAFSWGGAASLVEGGAIRAAYIAALRNADNGDLTALGAFART